MVETQGYPLESHQIETEDGYILTLLRVPNSKDVEEISKKPETIEYDPDGHQYPDTEIKPTAKPVVLIVHGFQCSSADWFMNTEDKILPYQLANAGYDCWLANLRGTPLSKGHVSLKPKSRKYWDFGFHEMALFDVPAMVNYILETTGNKSLYYIGHSMGCSVFFAGMSLKPEFCSKITAMVALAPAVHANNFRAKFRRARTKQAFPKPMGRYAKVACPPFVKNPDKFAGWVTRRYGTFFGGIGTDQVEKARIEKISEHWPASTSVKTMCHGMQCIFRKSFAQFDYGSSENLIRYGNEIPPLYDLTKVSVPVATFHAKDDTLCSSQDVTQLSKDLPNLIGNFGITHPNFTHGDFVFGKDAVKLVYQPVIEILQKTSMVDQKRLNISVQTTELP